MKSSFKKQGLPLCQPHKQQKRNCYVALLLIILLAPMSAHAEGLLGRIFFFGRGGESAAEKERTAKDLMRAAIDQVVFDASQVNGFYHEADMKIQIPEKIKKIEDISKKLKIDFFWRDIELGLNRAAEKAAPKAGVLMKSALEDLQFEKDPEKILREEGSMIPYFRRKMEERLRGDFKKEIERSVSGENALASYVEIKNLYTAIPFVKNSDQVFVLEAEISRKALDGIFSRVEEQESRLRTVRSGS